MTELIDTFRDRASARNNIQTYRETTNYAVYKLVSKRKETFNLYKEYSCLLIVLTLSIDILGLVRALPFTRRMLVHSEDTSYMICK